MQVVIAPRIEAQNVGRGLCMVPPDTGALRSIACANVATILGELPWNLFGLRVQMLPFSAFEQHLMTKMEILLIDEKQW